MKKFIGLCAVCTLATMAQPVSAQTDMMKGDMGRHEMMEMKEHAKNMENDMMNDADDMMAGHAMTFTLQDKNMKDVGNVTMEHGAAQSVLTVDVHDMAPGWHGFHVHEKGDCSDHEAFKSSGGHAHMEGQMHGVMDEEHKHAGDLPNIWVGADGTGKAQIFTDISHDMLQDEDGSAFVIHEGADDYASEPAGAAGGRVACGVIYPAGQ